MYWRHFHLTAEPFSLTPDPSFLYLSPVHAEAYAAMTMGLRERRGLITMIGEVGTGKTTLVYSLLSGLGPEIHTAYVSNARLSFDGILRIALRDFGVPCESTHSGDLLDAFNKFLTECANQGTTAAMVIDEAQNLSHETFEDLRLLSNFETYTHKLLQIVLVGQPELDAKLRDPALRQVAERVAVRCVVNPLNRGQARGYLEHRLAAVNGSLDIFTQPALRLLVAKSRGIPRSLNILAHNAMLFAYGEGRDKVNRRLVVAAIREKEGRSLVRLWRRPKSAAGHGAPKGMRSSWTLAVAALGGLLVGLAVAGGERVIGSLSDNQHRRIEPLAPTTHATPAEPAPAVAPSSLTAVPDVEAPASPATEIETASESPLPQAVIAPADIVAVPTDSPEPVGSAPLPVAPVVGPAPVAATEAASPDIATLEPMPTVVAPAAVEDIPQVPSAPAEAIAPAPTPIPIAPPAAVAAQPAPAATPETPRVTTAVREQPPRVARPAPAQSVRPAAAAPRPAVRQAAAPAPRTPQVAPPAVPANNNADSNRVRVVTVPAGSSLSDLMLAVYGQYSSQMIERVQAVNPQATDPDYIVAGDRLRFPDGATTPNSPAAGAEPR